MEYEFEGRTEKEAIDRAAGELGLEKDDFDVEILETQKSGLFKKGLVRIRVHVPNTFGASSRPSADTAPVKRERDGNAISISASKATFGEPAPQNEFEEKMIAFTTELIEHMGYPGSVTILFREKNKLGVKIDSSFSSILIGKKGKNLDALQLLLNIYAARLGREDLRVILDTENYRVRREESIVRLAYSVAEKVRESRGSILLEPMNQFERWLIHTTLNDIGDVETKSEGDGLYKQVRVYYRGLK
ncbi:MAG: protein jag [Treponema sp.]|jgi:spoIIIJ-associated protein|nr:protein jag [Treponema sp.]